MAVGRRSQRVILPSVRLPSGLLGARSGHCPANRGCDPIDGEAAIPQEEELPAVFGADRPQSTVTGTCTGARLADPIQGSVSRDGKHRVTQRLQISAVGGQTDWCAAAEAGDTVMQRRPKLARFALACHGAPHLEAPGVVDGGSMRSKAPGARPGSPREYAALLVVHPDPVLWQEVLPTPLRGASAAAFGSLRRMQRRPRKRSTWGAAKLLPGMPQQCGRRGLLGKPRDATV